MTENNVWVIIVLLVFANGLLHMIYMEIKSIRIMKNHEHGIDYSGKGRDVRPQVLDVRVVDSAP
jgi:hypothetical protein